ncbi:hypothetical protein CEXT_210101 [Caerostris extrusa]|uniref:Uncharacterized protein n=1 Tax=Caerostris extrusa TaxID=172846 RepID=A0AAV4NXX2_CAEEX|nr:hypothetical protein CEXT_210101 [Caerostris extrusa]
MVVEELLPQLLGVVGARISIASYLTKFSKMYRISKLTSLTGDWWFLGVGKGEGDNWEPLRVLSELKSEEKSLKFARLVSIDYIRIYIEFENFKEPRKAAR